MFLALKIEHLEQDRKGPQLMTRPKCHLLESGAFAAQQSCPLKRLSFPLAFHVNAALVR